MYTGRIWSPRSAALARAELTTVLALSVNRSNMVVVPFGLAQASAAGGKAARGAARVLFVNGLPGHAEDLGDLLPGPAVLSCVVHLQRFELPSPAPANYEPLTKVR